MTRPVGGPRRRGDGGPAAGLTLAEGLVALTVLGLLAALAIGPGAGALARLRVESGIRRVALGLELGRAVALRRGQPCALELSEHGWQAPSSGSLPACAGVALALGEGMEPGDLRLSHNLPAAVRFSSNGLVLDGGTVLVGAEGTDLVRCLVMALPLGVVRLGRHGDEGCRPDPTL